MNYKAIIFDLDNTLLNYSVSELKSMQYTVQEHGLIQNEAFIWDTFWKVYSKINMSYWNARKKPAIVSIKCWNIPFKTR